MWAVYDGAFEVWVVCAYQIQTYIRKKKQMVVSCGVWCAAALLTFVRSFSLWPIAVWTNCSRRVQASK